MRNTTLWLTSLMITAGCASGPRIVPSAGAPQAVAAAGGVTITVVDQPWEGSPGDLIEYVTPVPIELVNGGTTEVRVSYFDFALIDDQGFRYPALNPFATGQPSGARDPAGADDTRRAGAFDPAAEPEAIAIAATAQPIPWAERSVLVALPGGRFAPPPSPRAMSPRPHFGGYVRPPSAHFGVPRPRYGGVYYGPRPRPHFFGWRAGFGHRTWVGYRPLPLYRPWLGPSFGLYWNDPFMWPAGYSTWVHGWGPAYYPRSSTVPADVVSMAMPEGVIQPNGRVGGFIYFQRPKPEIQHMTLTWQVVEARQGGGLGQAQLALDVVQ